MDDKLSSWQMDTNKIFKTMRESTTMATTEKVEETVAVDLGSLLDAGDSAVVTLVAGETRLAAHRAVLVARSPVFDAMFRHDTLEASSGEVIIADVEGPVLRQLLSYCYSLQAPQLPATAPHLLAAADKYGLSDLKAVCEQQLTAQLTVENAAATAVLAVRHSCPDLTAAAIAFVRSNSQVMATHGWAEAMRSQPQDLIEVSRLVADPPAETSSRATKRLRPDTSSRLHGHSDRTTVAAAPPAVRRRIRPPNDTVLSYYLSLSGAEKASRLWEAADQGLVTEVQALLAAGADEGPNMHSTWGWTALHLAAQNGHVEVVRCLAEAGADVDAMDDTGCTPLHIASFKSSTAVVQQLLASSCDPNARNKDGMTPLHYAARQGNTEAVVALLEKGADREARDSYGRTPLDRARSEGNKWLIEILT